MLTSIVGSRRKLLSLAAAAVLLAMLSAPRVFADSLTASFYSVSPTTPDFQQKGIDGSAVTGLVQAKLGPDGLPVVSSFGASYSGPSGAITDVNSSGELQWWTPGNGVAFLSAQTVALPLDNPSDFFVPGQTSDSSLFLTANFEGTFNLSSAQTVTLNLGSDDDAWVFIDGNLVDDDGGIHALNTTPTTTASLSAGPHSLDIFWTDRHQVQAGIVFSANIPVSATPEPSSFLLLGTALMGLGLLFYKRRTAQAN
ncbi:MAG: PEP-CTERM sorting domain-containing protein [Terriglobia bacterium]